MSKLIEIHAPTFPESVQSGTIVNWLKQPGESVELDEVIVEIETEKVVLEVNAPSAGVVTEHLKQVDEEVASNELISHIDPSATKQAPTDKAAANNATATENATAKPAINPAAKKLMDKENLDSNSIQGSGKGGRITKEDVINNLPKQAATTTNEQPKQTAVSPKPAAKQESNDLGQTRKKMSPIRRRISERLLQSSQQTAMLTTFNEVDMHSIIDIRKQHQDAFVKTHDVKLGFMSFFLKASAIALQKFAVINAQLDGNDIVYFHSCHISVAVSTNQGLVVPVLRNVEQKSLAAIEKELIAISTRARDNKLGVDDMSGGTFTVTNGGIFGSMLSTPIINNPQTAILGMHNIVQRPIVVDNAIVVRPIMYLALSYDHRLIDGKDAVQFLVEIKRNLENPINMLLN